MSEDFLGHESLPNLSTPEKSFASYLRENIRDITTFGVWMATEVTLFAAHQARLIDFNTMTIAALATAVLCGGYLLAREIHIL